MYHEHGSPNLVYIYDHHLPIAYRQRKHNLRNALYRIANANSIIFEILTVGMFIGALLYSASISQQINHIPSDSIYKYECKINSYL